jgi:hypothetical protein
LTEATLTFSTSEQAKQWLQNQSSATLTPVQVQAKKYLADMDTQIQALSEASKQLNEVSNKEIEKRNMKVYNRARALNKLARTFMDRFKKLEAPEQVTYDAVNRYTVETQKSLFVTDIDIKNWFPHISPFFIMDRRKFQQVYDKSRQSYNNLNNFVTNEYIKTKTLEETLQLLNELQEAEKQAAAIQQDKDSIRNERLPLEQEIALLEQKISELTTGGPIEKLNLVNAEIENLNNELKNVLRHLQKPFIKMQALATSGGGGGITPDELQKINLYLDNPFEALILEKVDCAELKELLLKLEGMLAKDTLKLKDDKQRKAEQLVAEILRSNSLAQLQLRCCEMAQRRSQLLASAKLDEAKANVSQYRDQLEQLKIRRTSVETHESVKANSYREASEKATNLKRSIERNVAAALNKKIQIA